MKMQFDSRTLSNYNRDRPYDFSAHIDDSELRKISKKIKPVVRFSKIENDNKTMYYEDDEGDLYYIKPVDLRGIAFTYEPKHARKAEGLKNLEDIITYHGCGQYQAFFAPSIAEVLAQIPKSYKNVVAFEVIEETAMYCNEFNDYFKTVTRLYGRAK